MGNYADRLEREWELRDRSLHDAHERGEHTEPVKDCSRCWAAAKEAAGRPKPLRLPPGMRWRAHDSQGIGHLLPRTAGITRYLCNAVPIAERFAWPMRERCPECVRVLEAGRA